MMISGLRSQNCISCPAKFLVLLDSTRRECLRCEQKRQRLDRRRKESKSWHANK